MYSNTNKQKFSGTEMIANFQIVQKIANQLIEPRPCNYGASEIWKHISNKQSYKYQSYQLNIFDERIINLHIIQKTNQQSINKNHSPSTCILYLHGFSSFSGEGNFLTQNLQKQLKDNNVSLCLYDLRGHGKDNAKNITFGLQQSKQLCKFIQNILVQILVYLKKQRKFENFILWGRSMGATTILKMLSDQKGKIQSQNIHIILLVLDSGFSSFEKIALQMISKRSGIPTLLSKPIFQYFLSSIEKQHKLKLVVELDKLNQITTPALFLYSQKDNLISSEHSKYIYEKCSGQKYKLQTGVGHNEERPPQILKEVFQLVRNFLRGTQNNQYKRKSTSCKKAGISLTKSNKRLKTNQVVFNQEDISLSLKNKFKQLIKSPKNKDGLNKKTEHKLNFVKQKKKIEVNQNSIKTSLKPHNVPKITSYYFEKKTKNPILIEETYKTQGYDEKQNINTESQIIQEKGYNKRDQKIRLSSKHLDRVKSTGKLNSYKGMNHSFQNRPFIQSQAQISQQIKKQVVANTRKEQDLLRRKLQLQKHINQQQQVSLGKLQPAIKKPQSQNIHRLKSKIHSIAPYNNIPLPNRQKPNPAYFEQRFCHNQLRSSITEELFKQHQRSKSKNNPVFFNDNFSPKIKGQLNPRMIEPNRRLFVSHAQTIRRLSNQNYY